MPEDSHQQIRRLRTPPVVSALARVEVPAAIWRKHRTGELDLDDTQILLRAFAADYGGSPGRLPRFLAFALTGGVLERAAELTGVHGLRAYDAVQLASALAVREQDERCATFASFNRRLAAAARAEGFTALPKIPAPNRGS